jgi:hypothetical protein
MKKTKALFVFISSLILSIPVIASNTTGNNVGTTGILETPNTRIMPDWSMRMFFNENKPYRHYGFVVSPLPFLEVNFHATEVDGIIGNNKDKSVSFKIMLQEEGKLLPSVVFGGDDIWGSGLYTSKYIALGKQIGYFDFTLGYAKGRLGGNQIKPLDYPNEDNKAFEFMKDLSWKNAKPFGNILFNATPQLSLIAEYSPINYSKDRINPFLNTSKYNLPGSKINVGAKYSFNDNSNINLSFQRGDQFSFGYSYQFGFSKNNIFSMPPLDKRKADDKTLSEYKNLDKKQLSDKLSNELADQKLLNVQTSVNNNKIWTEFDNANYFNDLTAIGRAISSIDEVAPKKYDTIYTTIKHHNLPSKTVKVNRKEYDSYENSKVSNDYFKNAMILTNSVNSMENEFKENRKDIYKTSEIGTDNFKAYVGPEVKTFLNTRDNPLTIKISAIALLEYNISKGIFFKSKFTHPLYNTIDDINNDESPEDNKLSSNSNMLDYYKYNKTQMQRLTADYVFKAPFNSIGKVEVGYLDFAFAGTDIEWYKSFFDDKFGLGLQYQYVYKRPVDDMIKIESNLKYDAKFLNAYYLLSEKYDTHLGLKFGEFLAGDKGVKIDFTRNYKNFTLGAFATFTDSDNVFTNKENKDYIDKGIYIKIPFNIFSSNAKNKINYELRPWTRSVGQYSNTSMSLYPMNNSENNIRIMKKNIKDIIE